MPCYLRGIFTFVVIGDEFNYLLNPLFVEPERIPFNRIAISFTTSD